MAQLRRGPLFKGHPHHDYQRHAAALDEVFQFFFPNFSENTIIQCHERFGVPVSTLYSWLSKWRVNPDWRPWKSDKRLQHRIFSDKEEEALSCYIINNYITPGILFTNEDFKALAVQAYLEKYRDAEEIPEFQASDGFVTGFKKRNHFSTRRAHAKRRPTRTSTYDDTFHAYLSEILANNDNECVINVDETFWRVVPGDLRTWGEKGADSVQIHPNGGEKDGVTVVAAITAAGTKLPLQIIATGKTSLSEKQLGDVAHHITAHSRKGWTVGVTFREFLMHIRERSGHDRRLWIVLDCFAAHREQETQVLAESLNMELVYIPAGYTDAMQPLDRSVFATLKSYLKRLWRQQFQDDPHKRFTKAVAVQLLIPAWERVSPQLILSSWSIYTENSESDDEN